MEKLELRMYGLVPYQLTGIQMGIQFGHAAVEYGLKFFNDEEYQEWAKMYKTFIILNGGFSNHSQNRYTEDTNHPGTMESNLLELINNDVKIGSFYEPDLNDMLSAVVFIVDERVFNRKKYPDFDLKEFYGVGNYRASEIKINEIYLDPMDPKFPNLYNLTDTSINHLQSATDSAGRVFFHITGDSIRLEWDKWVESIGGKKNLFLRLFLDPKNFKLA